MKEKLGSIGEIEVRADTLAAEAYNPQTGEALSDDPQRRKR